MRALSFGKLVLATIALAGLLLLSPPVAAANSITVDLLNGSLTGISQGTVVGNRKVQPDRGQRSAGDHHHELRLWNLRRGEWRRHRL